MTISKVVVNSSPLITLYNSQLISLMPLLFNQICIPPAVWREVTLYKVDEAAQSLPKTSWVAKTATIAVNPLISNWNLGDGETEVLSYALSHPEFTAIVDDAAARKCAVSLNISTIGTVGMIVLAKRRGLIPSVTAPIQALRNAGLWLGDDLVDLLKKQAGESDH